ncbi:MAG: histidine phosphatase family protein [Oligoflexia bacterium]|nr:histidine phosphatase family protein [Oligoflexia bacterium]
MPHPSREIFIFRHGETDWNREGRFQGHVDIPLNDHGRAQAEALAEKLSPHGLEAILSSDLSRARETAEIVARRTRIPVFTDVGLREAHLGGAQGLTVEEIKRVHGAEVLERWKSVAVSDADVRYPGGETGAEVIERVFASLEKFIATTSYLRFGVACHGGVIRRVMQNIIPQSDAEPQKRVLIPNGVVYKILWEAKTGWNVPSLEPLGSVHDTVGKSIHTVV